MKIVENLIEMLEQITFSWEILIKMIEFLTFS